MHWLLCYPYVIRMSNIFSLSFYSYERHFLSLSQCLFLSEEKYDTLFFLSQWSYLIFLFSLESVLYQLLAPSRSYLVTQVVKRLLAMWETRVQSLGWEDPLGEEVATLSSILAWEILWTEEPGGLQSIGSQRVGHDWVTKYFTHTNIAPSALNTVFTLILAWWLSLDCYDK